MSKKLRKDRFSREKACAVIGAEVGLSAMTVWRLLMNSRFNKTKPTRKPGLNTNMKKIRHEFCAQVGNWTLEDWKNVIWSDETSVVLGYRRGKYRVWRTPDETCQRSCIRERWKGPRAAMNLLFRYLSSHPANSIKLLLWWKEGSGGRAGGLSAVNIVRAEMKDSFGEESDKGTSWALSILLNRF